LVSPTSGWAQGVLPNASQQLTNIVIPVTGTWLISFSIVITSTAVTSGQIVFLNADISNIGIVPDQITFGGAFNNATGLTFHGSFVVNGISGSIVVNTQFTGGNGILCLYSYSYLQAVRIA